MSKKLFDYGIVALCGAFSILLKEKGGFEGVSQYLLPPLGGMGLYAVLTGVLTVSERSRIIRRLVRKESRIEGTWIAMVEKEGVNYYSLFNIYYDLDTQKYHTDGRAMTEDGTFHAEWKSTQLSYDHARGRLVGTYAAKVVGITPFDGHMDLSFLKGSGTIVEGHGFFIDMTEVPIKFDYHFNRVTPGLVVQLLGKKVKQLVGEERMQFVRKYHEKMKGQNGVLLPEPMTKKIPMN